MSTVMGNESHRNLTGRIDVDRSVAAGALIREDITILSSCEVCLNQCPITVRRVNGVVVKVEGNPHSEKYQGVICAKGAAAPMFVYDPNRLNYPLLRTNPEKGHGVDPRWKRISWDEAMKIAANRLKKTIKDDPRKLILYYSVLCSYSPKHASLGFLGAIGSPHVRSGASIHCGNSEHLFSFSRQSLSDCPDWQYANYVIQLGINVGAVGSYRTRISCRRSADARVRGMKVVVVDPVGASASDIADEWIPIRPGTDGALLLAMMNVILNELKMFDAEYLTKETNLPYLVRSDGLYMRDAFGKPLMYDATEGKAKPYDAQFVNIALEGEYEFAGVKCKTAFELLRESVQAWTPERAEGITTVPAITIRRLTKELVDSAQLGATITLDGKTLRYRPAAIVAGRGLVGHDNTTGTWMAVMVLGELLGLPGAVGGIVYAAAVSHGYRPEMYSWDVRVGPDGLYEGWWYLGPLRGNYAGYPIPEPQAPRSFSLHELNPLPLISPLVEHALLEPERFGLNINTNDCFLIAIGGNFVYNLASPDLYLEAYKRCFTVTLQTYLNDSVNAVADLVLPGTCHLERLSVPQPITHQYQQMGYPGTWECYIRQPVVTPLHERRDEAEVLIELVDRAGLRKEFNAVMNVLMMLKEPWRLEEREKYTWAELVDRYCRSHFGADKGLDWWKVNGMLAWPSKIEEWYWPQFIEGGRFVVYYEHLLRHAAQMKEIINQMNIDYPMEDWGALPYWKPCAQLRHADSEYDMKAIYYKHPLSSLSFGRCNVWLDEVSRRDIAMDFALMNSYTARAKGIRDGDAITIEAPNGRSICQRVRLSELIHPEVIAVCNGLANGSLHISPGRETKFNWLLTNDWDHTDKVVQAIETDCAVKVCRASRGGT